MMTAVRVPNISPDEVQTQQFRIGRGAAQWMTEHSRTAEDLGIHRQGELAQ